MRPSTLLFPVISLLLSCVVSTTSAEPAAQQEFDLDGLIESAMQQSATLEFAQSALDASRISEKSLPWWDAPEIRLGYGRDAAVSDRFKSANYPNHDYDTSLRFFPKNPWEHKAQRRQLQADSRLQELYSKEVELEITRGITELYWEAGYTHSELKLRNQLKSIYQEQVDGMEKLLEVSQITLAGSLAAKMKLLNLRVESETLQRNYNNLIGQLGMLCNLDPSTIKLSEILQLSDSSFDLPYTTWKNNALSARPDAERYSVLVEKAQADLSVIKASQQPWIKFVQFSYSAENDYGEQDTAGIEIAFDLPFFASDGGQKEIASNMERSHRKQEVFGRQMIELEVRSLIEEFKALQRQWQTQGKLIDSMQTELSSAIDKMKTQGNHANRDYLDARITLLELELKQLELCKSFQDLQIKRMQILGQDS
ncbi:MAG: TolC family protein [Opitutales bacterium]|jgi:outer membrane protein TolC|nr:TolC family protein [Opitutales bacterium]MDP4644586.1 TolC family protein [Opitutales bacterium]MDP4776828.1 TolC family protein [Opitutales bacterium]MDP5079913.1 TolC family protein [Opitutales bacterium]